MRSSVEDHLTLRECNNFLLVTTTDVVRGIKLKSLDSEKNVLNHLQQRLWSQNSVNLIIKRNQLM